MNRIAPLFLFLATPTFASTPRASSEYRGDDGTRFGAAQAFDGQLATAWAEGDASEDGVWVELRLDRTTAVHSVSVWPGELSRGTRSLREWARPRTLTVTLTGGAEEVTASHRLIDPALDRAVRIDIPIEGTARTVRVSVDDTYEGVVQRRVALAEVAINHVGDEEPPGADRLMAWLESDAGQRASARDTEELAVLAEVRAGEDDFEQARAARDSLMARAADGAPYVRTRAMRDVPQGFWMRAIPPQSGAVSALTDAQDPTVIPALELASLRATGALERRLRDVVERYQAWTALRGGAHPNVPPWGQEGWSEGELQTFGEPLPVAVDQLGLVYVADAANNRVQRFNERGVVERVTGADEPGICRDWVGGPRRWYPCGSASGTDATSLTVPLSVAVVPGKDADGVVVLDAAKRVHVYNADGTPTATWSVDASARLHPRLGGQAYVLLSKGKVVVLWGDEGFVYRPDGTALGTFSLDEGAPSGAVVLKNGKLGLLYQQELVMYSLDGFRYGVIGGGELDAGFESWDVTMDETRHLWAVTDTGWVYQFKKPGRIAARYRVTTDGLTTPRIAAREGRVWITQNNHVVSYDILALLAQEAAESAEAQ